MFDLGDEEVAGFYVDGDFVVWGLGEDVAVVEGLVGGEEDAKGVTAAGGFAEGAALAFLPCQGEPVYVGGRGIWWGGGGEEVA